MTEATFMATEVEQLRSINRELVHKLESFRVANRELEIAKLTVSNVIKIGLSKDEPDEILAIHSIQSTPSGLIIKVV